VKTNFILFLHVQFEIELAYILLDLSNIFGALNIYPHAIKFLVIVIRLPIFIKSKQSRKQLTENFIYSLIFLDPSFHNKPKENTASRILFSFLTTLITWLIYVRNVWEATLQVSSISQLAQQEFWSDCHWVQHRISDIPLGSKLTIDCHQESLFVYLRLRDYHKILFSKRRRPSQRNFSLLAVWNHCACFSHCAL